MLPLAASFPCCRAHDLFVPLEQYPDALRRNLAAEAYWFKWSHSFGGEATIRVARLGNEAMATRLYRASHFGKTRCRHSMLTMAEWGLLEDAVVRADFWRLDEQDGYRGCDGANWMIAGCRRKDYHRVRRWSPDGPLYDFGRLLFDLAGLTEVTPL